MNTLPQIYCDMDQVLVDFIGGANAALMSAGLNTTFGAKDQHVGKDTKWEALKKVPKFWANLNPMPDGILLWKFIRQYDPIILSTPSKRMQTCKPEKIEWIHNHLGHVKEIMLVPREDKQKYAVSKGGAPNLLIDDYSKNIEEWKAKGGIGVHHINTMSTISQLRKLGY